MTKNHRWFVCHMCGQAVLCGTCGNNSCNGGIGRVGGDISQRELPECPDCRDSWEWEKVNPCPPELQAEWEANRDRWHEELMKNP